MKKLVQLLKPTKKSFRVTSLGKNNILDKSLMKKIRGGEGDDNGGLEIIIIPSIPPKK